MQDISLYIFPPKTQFLRFSNKILRFQACSEHSDIQMLRDQYGFINRFFKGLIFRRLEIPVN